MQAFLGKCCGQEYFVMAGDKETLCWLVLLWFLMSLFTTWLKEEVAANPPGVAGPFPVGIDSNLWCEALAPSEDPGAQQPFT